MSDGGRAPGAPGGEHRTPPGQRRTSGGRRRASSSGRRASGGRRDQRTSGNLRAQEDRRNRRAQARRAVVVPPITYPEDLPVSARREDIAAAIRDHQVVIVAGETGSGKTTQLPKILLDLGRGRDGQIGHTQPRRIAARTVAERISQEVSGGKDALGTIVGYQVRFTDQSSEQTLVKVMTDGILLAQIQRDPLLLAYDTLIIDEAHERSLNIDFILGYLTRLLPQRPDLKVVITSATIDSERFARHFAGPPTPDAPDGVPAPVIEVTGRTYPVEIRYRPLVPDTDRDPDEPGTGTPTVRAQERDLMTAICEAVDELVAEGPGDVLVFLSGEREIRDAEDALRNHLGTRATDPRHPRAVELLPLYSRLSAAEQHRVFQPHGTRRVVLATNVAETSLTVPGVRYVVDPGTARISRFSKSTKVQRLPIEPISQASANQRSGRCGRVADGIAIRLYSEADFASRPEFTEPEILRTSLASVILQMIAVGVAATPDDVARFPFVEPPDVRAVRDGVQLLTELGALTTAPLSPPVASEEDEAITRPSSDAVREGQRGRGTRLTEVGRGLALLPMDPRLARMIIEGGRRDVAREVMVIAAALSIQDPRERPTEQREQADQQHARFADPTSDFLTYLNMWTYVRDRQRELSGSAFRRLCRAEHLNYLRLREWQDVVAQLSQMAKPLGITVRPPGHRVEAEPGSLRLAWDAERIHRAILSGLLSHVGMQEVTEVRAAPARGRKPATSGRRQGRNEYRGARGAQFAIFPGSRLSKKPPAWIMAAELVETSRLWARDVARIEPEWAEELAPHLVKRVYSEPAWSTKRAAAIAQEKVLLYGLPIVAQRRVLYAKVDPEHARELFIRHALVQGEWTTHHEFFARNRALLADAEEVEHRARRRGLVVDDDALFDFYDERVPDEVVSARHFDTWWKTARRRDPDLLTFSPQMLLADEAPELDESQFPTTWPQGDLELPVTYQFDPGSAADGITVHIPLPVLGRVRPEGFDWLVPGMLEELTTATIRSLPKAVRVQLVPAPDVARAVVARLRADHPAWEDVVRAADMAPSFREAFADAVRALRQVEIPDEAWDDERLPGHLRVTFRVHEERAGSSTLVDEGSDLVALQRRLAGRTQQAVRTAVRDAVQAAVREAGRDATRGSGGDGAPAPGSPSAPVPTGGAAPADTDLEQVGLTGWPQRLPAGRIPEVVRTDVGGITVHGYPALVVEPTADAAAAAGTTPKGGSRGPGAAGGTGGATRVSLRVLAHEAERDVRHAAGVRELLLTELALPAGRVTSRWSGAQTLTLGASPYPTTSALVTDLQRAAVDAIVAERPHAGGTGSSGRARSTGGSIAGAAASVRDADAYTDLRTVVREALEDRTFRVASDAADVLTQARELEAALRAASSPALLSTVVDLRDQLGALVHDGFVSRAGATRLPHLVRYLRAGRHRLEKAAESPQRDESIAWQVRELTAEHEAAVTAARAAPPDPERDARLVQVRWMLEELRVSLFAQQLGTAHPVSAKRIRAALNP